MQNLYYFILTKNFEMFVKKLSVCLIQTQNNMSVVMKYENRKVLRTQFRKCKMKNRLGIKTLTRMPTFTSPIQNNTRSPS